MLRISHNTSSEKFIYFIVTKYIVKNSEIKSLESLFREIEVKVEVPQIVINIVIPPLDSKEYWDLINCYSIFEMIGRRCLAKYLEGKGLEGLKKMVEGLTCSRLVECLRALNLVDENDSKILYDLVSKRNKIAHSIEERVFLNPDEVKETIRKSRIVIRKLAKLLQDLSNRATETP